MRILTFDIGGTTIKIGVVDDGGNILESKEIETHAKDGGEAIIQRIFKEIDGYKNIDKIGISTAGQIDVEKGRVVFSSENIPGWSGMRIKERIEELFYIPTAVENDVNCAALAEAYYGAGKDYSDFLCLTYGTGIGGAIIQNSKIYHGATGSAAEFGHMITHGEGLCCNCGGRGCYERYASTSALVKRVKESSILKPKDLENIDGRYIFEMLSQGNEEYVKLIDLWINEILIGLTSIIHFYNPSLIVLGGGVMEQDYIIRKIQQDIYKYVMPNFEKVIFKKAMFLNNAGLIGASIIAN